jgi:hypothetical protein
MIGNPLRILQTLDRHLHQPFDLYVYGRSALALGYRESLPVFHATMDVDAILPARDIGGTEDGMTEDGGTISRKMIRAWP